MKAVVWRKMGIVVVLVMAIAAVLRAKQLPGAGSPGTPAPSQATSMPRLLDLGAATCIPCKMMQPVMDELKARYAGKLRVDFINVADDPTAARAYGINAIPTQIFYDAGGQELYRHTGFYGKDEIVAKFNELGVRL